MAYDAKDVRTVMDPMDNQYHYVLTIILISLIVAAGISVFFTTGPGLKTTHAIPNNTQKNDESSLSSDSTGSWIVRILWFDDQNRTYSFLDYPTENEPDPDAYQYSGDIPAGAKPAMMRFLSWDGNTERTIGARYIEDQETVTSILNRYSLIASKDSMPVPSVVETKTPIPSGSPVPGMLIPESGIVCRNTDGTYTAWFGYQSMHDYPVSLPVGDQNRFLPGDTDRGQPVVFTPGIHHDVFSITYPANATNQIWSLMGSPVSAGTVPEVNTSITIEPTSGYAPLEVRMSERSTGAVVNNPLSGSWDLGDGTITSKTGSLSHRYEKPGRYQISYTVSNKCDKAADSGLVEVFDTSYTWMPDPKHPGMVLFQDTSGGEPSVWFWDFGDEYSSWEQSPVHTYTRPGSYNVGLTVSGVHGKGMVVHSISIPENSSLT